MKNIVDFGLGMHTPKKKKKKVNHISMLICMCVYF